MRFTRRPVTPLPPDPDCAQVEAVLHAYADGELGPEDGERVAEHLEHCDRCGIEAATVDRVILAIRRQRPDLERAALDRLGRFVHELTDGGPPLDR
jgi:anti-sigma factor RsiW